VTGSKFPPNGRTFQEGDLEVTLTLQIRGGEITFPILEFDDHGSLRAPRTGNHPDVAPFLARWLRALETTHFD
jgi:hypothetical protein